MLHQLKMKMMLAEGCTTTKVALKKSGILHRDASRGVLSARPVDKPSIERYYYSSFLCEYLSLGGSRFNTFGERIVKLKSEAFPK